MSILDHKLLLLLINLFFLFIYFCWAPRECKNTCNVLRTKEICLPQSLKDHLIYRSYTGSCRSIFSFMSILYFPLSFSIHRDIYCYCCCLVSKSCLTVCYPRDCSTPASLSFTVSWVFFNSMSTESVIRSNHLILCHPHLLLPSIFPSIRVFSNGSALCISWPSCEVSASVSVLPMNIHSCFPLTLTGLISLQAYINTHTHTHTHTHIYMYVCIYIYMYICVYIYICIYVYIYIYIYIYIQV